MEYLYKITVNFEGKMFISNKEILKITDKSIICNGARYNKKELDKITMHNCTFTGQSAIYTLDVEKIQEYVKKLICYYKEIWKYELDKINKKLLTIDEKPIMRFLKEKEDV